MTTYDIIDMTYTYCNKNAKHTVEEIRDLLLQLDGGSTFFKMSLEWELALFAETQGVCPKCGSSIVTVNEVDEDRGEYFGTPVVEKEVSLGCSECDYLIP